MSRIGKQPVSLVDKVQAQVDGQKITIKSGANEQVLVVHPSIEIVVSKEQIVLKPRNDERQTRAYHGLYRALLQNAVQGVTKGWSKTLTLNGVGYRAKVAGQKLELNLGYSHPVVYNLPKGIAVKVEKQTTLHVQGVSRALVGQVAANIRGFRPPEPYLAKGVKYAGEHIRRKAGKAAAGSKS